MKKLGILIPVLMWMAGACSGDDKAVIVPELPDGDMNIEVPAVPVGWEPGMAYEPYADNLLDAPGVEVNVLVVGEGELGRQELAVLNNEVWIWGFEKYGKPVMQRENVKWCFFPNHEDIRIRLTGSVTDFNPDGWNADIVVLGFPVERLADAQRNMNQLLAKFDRQPLVIVPGGDYESVFSQEAWDFCLRCGGLDWEKDVLPQFPDWEVNEDELTEEQAVYYHPGNVGAAYAVQNVNGHNRGEDWIVVGSINTENNLPGPILMDRWICAPYSFNMNDLQVGATALGAAYVAKIAAEIKRRLPNCTNAEIADLIFENADNLSVPESYGWGIINPKKIWSAVENIEAQNLK